MKNLPKVIYLQVGEDCDVDNFEDLHDVCWCESKIHSSDIRYIIDGRHKEGGG